MKQRTARSRAPDRVRQTGAGSCAREFASRPCMQAPTIPPCHLQRGTSCRRTPDKPRALR
eukprot:1262810-Alexandrium_andersonii.AAC.1